MALAKDLFLQSAEIDRIFNLLENCEVYRMSRAGFIAVTGICIGSVGMAFSALPSRAVNVKRPSLDRCVAVSKQEYESAYRQNYLRTQFTEYARTGALGRHHYWYCHS